MSQTALHKFPVLSQTGAAVEKDVRANWFDVRARSRRMASLLADELCYLRPREGRAEEDRAVLALTTLRSVNRTSSLQELPADEAAAVAARRHNAVFVEHWHLEQALHEQFDVLDAVDRRAARTLAHEERQIVEGAAARAAELDARLDTMAREFFGVEGSVSIGGASPHWGARQPEPEPEPEPEPAFLPLRNADGGIMLFEGDAAPAEDVSLLRAMGAVDLPATGATVGPEALTVSPPSRSGSAPEPEPEPAVAAAAPRQRQDAAELRTSQRMAQRAERLLLEKRGRSAELELAYHDAQPQRERQQVPEASAAPSPARQAATAVAEARAERLLVEQRGAAPSQLEPEEDGQAVLAAVIANADAVIANAEAKAEAAARWDAEGGSVYEPSAALAQEAGESSPASAAAAVAAVIANAAARVRALSLLLCCPPSSC